MSKYRAEVVGKGEDRWTTNTMRFDTEEAAVADLSDLAGRWFGFDVGRVVTADVPMDEMYDPGDPQIVLNYRRGR